MMDVDEEGTGYIDDLPEEEQQKAVAEEKVRAKEYIVEFLQSKGVSLAVADSYLIDTRISNFGKKQTKLCFTTRYRSSDGLSLPSKYDCLNDAQKRDLATRKATMNANVYRREEHFQLKSEELASYEGKYPLNIDGFLVHSFGKIKVETSGSPEFHNSVQIYPIGYKVEIEFGSLRSLDLSTQYFICEIIEKDGGPEFTITNKSNGQMYWASTESMVFKRLETISGYANIAVQEPSFFNLNIELLIEGMEGALECPDYKFHGERGYGYTYFDQEGSIPVKSATLAKDSRERRNRRREALRFMTPEEAKIATALEKKRLAEEKEQEKLNAQAEKKRKNVEKKADKARVEASKAAVKAKKEKEKKEAEEARQQKREEEKAAKEKQKADEKYRSQYRRSIKHEVKKKRSEASMKVLDLFDKLEGGPDSDDEPGREQVMREPGVSSALDKAIEELKSCNEIFLGADKGVGKIDWNHALELANSLYLHKDILNLQFPCTLEHLINNLSTISGRKKIENGGDAMDVADDADGSKGAKVKKNKNHHSHISLDNIISKYPRLEPGNRKQAIAELDRTQLCIIRSMLEDIHRILDIDGASGENLPDDSRSAARIAFRLPLNQLTWPEIARMCLLSSAFKELRGDNAQTYLEVQFAIKGSRANPFRAQKNVVRHIRYLWHIRRKLKAEGKKEKLSSDTSSLNGNVDGTIISKLAGKVPDYVYNFANIDPLQIEDSILNNKQYPLTGTFTTEIDVLESLEKVAMDPEFSELYRRMACVLHKILNIPAAKNFLWDLDSDYMEDYFLVIKRPVMLVNVAMHIVNRSYDDVESVSDESVMRDFFLETQSVFTNCYVFNTELQALVGQAQRCSIAFTRHFMLWILGKDYYPIEKCSMKFCTFSQHLLQTNSWLACGRCAANVDVNQLEKVRAAGNPYLVMPTQELQASTLVEWVCPMCLQEDGLNLSVGKQTSWKSGAASRGSFWNDDQGPSSLIPWQFNTALSREADSGIKDSPSLRLTLEALRVLSDPMKTGILSNDGKDILGRDTAEGEDTASESESDSDRARLWTLHERLVVLLALCNYMRTQTKSIERINFLYQECEKLRTIAAQGTFREGDFMRVVKNLCGDEVTATCRAMLDGISGSAGSGLKREMKARVFEGRCNVCHVSTYEEDQEDGEEVGEVLLCEGCNAEVHLRCSGHATVPKEEWYCHECEARNQARGSGGILSKFNNVNVFRSVNVEEEIVNYKIDRIAAEEGHKVVDRVIPVDTTEFRCVYCDMKEIEVCSPLVCGQSRAEHIEYVAKHGRDKLFNRAGAQIILKIDGKVIPPPPMSLPYFPYLSSWDCDDLMEHALALQTVSKETQLYVHEMCALEMFRARLGTIRHAARRQRVKVADLAICMAGAIIRPLGVDDMGREYWRFPSCRGLFICRGPYGNEDEVAFNNSLIKLRKNMHSNEGSRKLVTERVPAAKAKDDKLWKVVIGNSNIRALASKLGKSPNETQLHRKLRSYFTELEEGIVEGSPDSGAPANPTPSKSSPDKAVAPGSSLATSVTDTEMPAPNLEAEPNSEPKLDPKPEPKQEPGQEPALSARQQAVADEKDRKIKEEAEAVAMEQRKSGVIDKTPVALELSATKGKGSGIDQDVCIQSETVFDEATPSTNADDGTFSDFSEYFAFGRKYYGVGLINADGRHLKPTKGEYKVTYMVHRAGLIDPLVCDYLTDPWTDGYYYFSSCTFKRSGQYTVSFLVEGENAHAIEPLVFPVSVRSMMTVCGPRDALDRLECSKFFDSANRRILVPKIKRSVVSKRYFAEAQNGDELSAVRACLLAIFIALPAGALATEITGKDGRVKQPSTKIKEAPRDENVTETIGWTDELESLWYDVVTEATCAKELMEAVVCMEYYIQRKWISEFGTKLLNALPPAHYAIRAPTLAAVAMRVYCLDKVLLYEKYIVESRTSRTTGGQRSSALDEAEDEENIGKVSGRKRARVNYAEVVGEDVYEERPAPKTYARGDTIFKIKEPAPVEENEEEDDYLPEIDFEQEIRECSKPPHDKDKDMRARAMSLLRALYDDSFIAFWHPVPEDVDGYHDIIKEPMDLSSLLKKVKTGRIREIDTFKSKLDLVWDNCMTFNDSGSQIHQVAKYQRARVGKMYHALFVSDDKPIDPDVLFKDDGSLVDVATEVKAENRTAPEESGASDEVKQEEPAGAATDVKMEVDDNNVN